MLGIGISRRRNFITAMAENLNRHLTPKGGMPGGTFGEHKRLAQQGFYNKHKPRAPF